MKLLVILFIQDEVLAKIVNNQKPYTVFAKPPSWMFDKVLNMFLN